MYKNFKDEEAPEKLAQSTYRSRIFPINNNS